MSPPSLIFFETDAFVPRRDHIVKIELLCGHLLSEQREAISSADFISIEGKDFQSVGSFDGDHIRLPDDTFLHAAIALTGFTTEDTIELDKVRRRTNHADKSKRQLLEPT